MMMSDSARENLRKLLDDTIENVRKANDALHQPEVGDQEIDAAARACSRSVVLLNGIRWALAVLCRTNGGEDTHADAT